jgi:hypothetical protein
MVDYQPGRDIASVGKPRSSMRAGVDVVDLDLPVAVLVESACPEPAASSTIFFGARCQAKGKLDPIPGRYLLNHARCHDTYYTLVS